MKRKHTKQPAAQVPAPQPRREVARLSPDPEQGLTLHQVKERQQNGWANDPVDSPTKTVGQIVRENVFTFFNFIFVVLAALLVGSYDGFYGPGTGTFLLLVLTGVARMDVRSASAQTKVINLSSNTAALVTFIFSGNVLYPLGLAAGICCIGGHYIGSGLVVHDGHKIVRPVVLVVLIALFVKVLSGR